MKHFKQHEVPKLKFEEAMKKPIPIKCFQMNEEFEIETMEGLMKGKKGDWLMVGINGEMYPCDNTIFEQTYTILK